MAIEQKALVLFYPGCIEFEIMLASELVSKEFPIEIATPDGLQHRSSTGIVYQAQHAYKDVKAADYQCLLIPGGDTYDVFENVDLIALLKEAKAKDVLIGAICAAPLLLAKAGILKGRKFTHGFGNFYKDFLEQYWLGADFIDEPVVVDGNIVTAKPEAHIDFAVSLARLAGAIEDDAKAGYYKKYYRGVKSSSVAQTDAYIRYVICLTRKADVKYDEALIRAHVAHLKTLDAQELLVLCGPFEPPTGGMIIVKAKSLEHARQIAESDPFVHSGKAVYELKTLHLSCEENNHMGMG